MKQTVLVITKMDCPVEEQLIRNRLKNLPEIESLHFNLMQRELTVSHRLDSAQILLDTLGPLNLGATFKDSAHSASSANQHLQPTLSARDKWQMALSGAAALGAELVAYSSGSENSPPVIALALFSIICGGRETFAKGLVALRTLTLNINFLMSLAVTGAILIGQWPEAAVVTWLFGVAETIEALSLQRARRAISELMQNAPETATVQSDCGHWHEIAADRVQIGQMMRVKPGERIALDGIVVSGNSSVDQAPITGESIAVEKTPGAPVYAGTLNQRGALEVQVTLAQSDSTLSRIVRAVQEAQSQRAPTQHLVDNFARFYTPLVVVLALLVALLPPLFWNASWAFWGYKALVMLVIACPCALVISTPVTIVSALARAAREGILVKGGAWIEAGRHLQVLALDKTGTLTQGRPILTDIVPLDDTSPNHALHLAASLNAASEHPLASAFQLKWAQSQNSELLKVTNFQAWPGKGVSGEIEGRKYLLGNARLMGESGIEVNFDGALNSLQANGKSALILADVNNARALAVFGVADTLRPNSRVAIAQLHDLGVRTVMLSGDSAAVVASIASQAGIEDARGELLPQEKLDCIAQLQKNFRVGMVGDGINDAPALAQSHVGFAMGTMGTDTAIETADVALMRDDLQQLAFFIRLCRSTGRILKQNIAFAIGIKIVFFALALTGNATLWMAVFADLGASLLVIFNGLRVLRFAAKN